MSASTTALTREEPKKDEPGKTVVEHLQSQVANAFILYANYKHYHWETYGPLYRELHLLFDEFATAVLSTSDEFAERLRFRGEAPVFDFRKMLEVSGLRPSTRGDKCERWFRKHMKMSSWSSRTCETPRERPTMTTIRAPSICFPKPCRFMRSTSGTCVNF